MASERAIAQSLGERAPVPPGFATAQKDAQNVRKQASTDFSSGQALLDSEVLRTLDTGPRRSLFSNIVTNYNQEGIYLYYVP